MPCGAPIPWRPLCIRAFSGATTPFPPNTTLTRTIPLQPAIRGRTPIRGLAAASATALLALAAPASAQLPSASARALGLADNYTAVARGYAAVSWNPAGLAMRDTPGWSVALLPVRGVGGLDPVTTSDLAEWDGEVVPDEVRRGWLEEIRAEGSQRGHGGGDLTLVAFNVGRFGAQVGTVARGTMSISPDAAELLLFGNAGRTGEPGEFSGSGSSLDVLAATTAAVGYGHPFRLGAGPDSRAAIGVTVKFTLGHYVLHGEDNGSRLSDDPLEGRLDFPIVHTDSASEGENGTGVGLDLGFAWTSGALTVGASVQNVFNSFGWDESELSWRPGQAFFDTDSTSSDFDAQPVETAPQDVADFVDDLGFERVVSLGIAYDAGARLTVNGRALAGKIATSVVRGRLLHVARGLDVQTQDHQRHDQRDQGVDVVLVVVRRQRVADEDRDQDPAGQPGEQENRLNEAHLFTSRGLIVGTDYRVRRRISASPSSVQRGGSAAVAIS